MDEVMLLLDDDVELDDRLEEFCLGFLFRVCIPSFLIASGRFTCVYVRVCVTQKMREHEMREDRTHEMR